MKSDNAAEKLTRSTIDSSSEDYILKRIGPEGQEIDGILYKNANIVRFEGKEYIVSHKAILTITVTEKCNAGCKFCFNGITNTPEGPFVSTDDPNVQRIKRFVSLAGVEKVAYSGGEPTLNPQKLYELVRDMNPGFQKSRINTNGIGLFRDVIREDGSKTTLLKAMEAVGLNGVTLSIAHYDLQKNREIMVLHGWAGFSKDDIQRVVLETSNAISVRLSCFLTPEGVWTVDDILCYIRWGESLGVNKFIIRSGSTILDEYSKDTSYTVYNKESIVDIDPLVKELLSNHGFKQIFEQHKSDSHVHVLKRNNTIVDIDHSSEELDPDRKIRRFVLMPNGVCYVSWIDQTKTLFDEDRQRIMASAIDKSTRKLATSYPAGLGHVLSSRKKENTSYLVDLHIHSWNSDGRLSQQEVLQQASQLGLKALVFTEHNAISDNHDEVVRIAADIGIEVPFPALEISTVYHNEETGEPERKYHVLAYGEGLQNSEFLANVNGSQKFSNDFYRDVVELLRTEKGIDIPQFKEIMRGICSDGTYLHPYRTMITRTTIAKYIAEALGIDMKEAKRRYLPRIESKDLEYPDTLEVIKMVRDLGGVPGLAHPGWDRPMPGFSGNSLHRTLEIIFLLRKHGMLGLESRHYRHDTELTSLFERYSTDLGLMTLGGSDFHGNGHSELGQYGITEKELERIKKHLDHSA